MGLSLKCLSLSSKTHLNELPNPSASHIFCPLYLEGEDQMPSLCSVLGSGLADSGGTISLDRLTPRALSALPPCPSICLPSPCWALCMLTNVLPVTLVPWPLSLM